MLFFSLKITFLEKRSFLIKSWFFDTLYLFYANEKYFINIFFNLHADLFLLCHTDESFYSRCNKWILFNKKNPFYHWYRVYWAINSKKMSGLRLQLTSSLSVDHDHKLLSSMANGHIVCNPQLIWLITAAMALETCFDSFLCLARVPQRITVSFPLQYY